jgi:transcription-repair coupling factor (superfamily II helicase)
MQIANPLQPPIPEQPGQHITWGNLYGASVGLALSSVIGSAKSPVVIIAPDPLTATRLEYELSFFRHDQPVIHFPDWETLPFDQFSPHQDIVSERLSALYRMLDLQHGVIVTPISTMMQYLSPRNYLEDNTFLLSTGQKFDLQAARQRLTRAG